MRFRHLMVWELRFMMRYSILLLDILLTSLYAALLISLPPSWKENTAALLIFSDPAAMGIFFMGAIVLLEKRQHVTAFLSVSPLRVLECTGAKVLSLSLIALLVAAVLGLLVRRNALFSVRLGTAIASIMFNLLGLILAVKIRSLNQFLLAAIPVEILTFFPACLHLFGITSAFAGIYPANVCMDLIAGRASFPAGMGLTAALIALLLVLAHKSVL